MTDLDSFFERPVFHLRYEHPTRRWELEGKRPADPGRIVGRSESELTARHYLLLESEDLRAAVEGVAGHQERRVAGGVVRVSCTQRGCWESVGRG